MPLSTRPLLCDTGWPRVVLRPGSDHLLAAPAWCRTDYIARSENCLPSLSHLSATSSPLMRQSVSGVSLQSVGAFAPVSASPCDPHVTPRVRNLRFVFYHAGYTKRRHPE